MEFIKKIIFFGFSILSRWLTLNHVRLSPMIGHQAARAVVAQDSSPAPAR